MKPESSRYLFLLGAFLLALVLFSFYAARALKKSSPKTNKLEDAGISILYKDPHSFTTFETGEDLKKLKKQKLQRLESYGWIDRKEGIAHIPIARAMDLFIKRQKQ